MASQKSQTWLLILVASLGYFVDIYDLILFQVVKEASLIDLGITDELLRKSHKIGLFNWQMSGMLVGGLIWGVLGDKLGRLKTLFGSILLYSLANIANAYEQYGLNVLPHGKEWKDNFSKLISQIIEHPELPTILKKGLIKSISNPKASSCNDIELSRILNSFDVQSEDKVYLENLPKNSSFVFNKRIFRKGDKRKTRFECKEINTGKLYLVHLLAKVKPIHHAQ